MEFLYLYLIFVAVSASVSVTINDDQCGVSDYHTSQLETSVIVNGAVVPQGKYPWMAELEPDGCTATILSRRYILTVAHCLLDCTRDCYNCELKCNPFPDDYKMTVVVGSVSIRNGKKIGVKRMIPHDNHSYYPNDIGIIELEEKLNYTKDIRPICLSGKPQVADPDKNVVIVGWGGEWIMNHVLVLSDTQVGAGPRSGKSV